MKPEITFRALYFLHSPTRRPPVSLALGYFVHPAWLLFTAFVGVNLLQSAFTRWCLMMNILEKAGLRTEQ